MGLLPDVRPLTEPETALARSVFLDTLPYRIVFIANDLGIGGRPWTESTLGGYQIHFGNLGYRDATASIVWPGFGPINAVFIHELTHVWQGSHSSFHEGYMIRSGLSQAWAWLTNSDAYNYTAGSNWSDYNVEQQAHIVEDWFKNGKKETDPLFRYIRDPIRSQPYWRP